MMRFALVQLNGSEPGRSVPLDPHNGAVTIGRDPRCEVNVDDCLCSRRHCRVWFEGGCWHVEDCGSRNGTYLNSQRIERDLLTPGDAIRVGDRLFLFAEQGEEEQSGWRPDQIERTTFLARIPATEQQGAVIRKLPAGEASKDIKNAAVLCQLAGELHQQNSVSGLLRTVEHSLVLATAAEGVVIWLRDVGGRLRRFGAKSRNRSHGASPLANLVMDKQDALLVSQQDNANSMESTIIDDKPGSAICVPIPNRKGCRGAIEVLRGSLDEPFDAADLELAIAVAQQAGLALENLEYRERLERANTQLRQELVGRNCMIGESPAMKRLFETISRVAATRSTVLISGESGTGKELVARMIHDSGPCADGPYVTVNCAAFADALLESELFGHEKGAFTGADKRHRGQFERAHRGSIFLDEVGEMSLGCQAKLLRVIEGHPFERLGGTDSIDVDVRVIAATHRDLRQRVDDGAFREDLMFRLCVIELRVPPLRERGDDVLLLAEYFLDRFCRELNRSPLRLSPDAVRALRTHRWPGNVRELKNCVERAAVLAPGPEVSPADLGLTGVLEEIAGVSCTSSPVSASLPPDRLEILPDAGAAGVPSESLADAELRHVLRVLQQAGGNKSRACRLLGIGRGTLYNKLKAAEERFGIAISDA